MKSKWVILITAALSTGCLQPAEASIDHASARSKSTAESILFEIPSQQDNLVRDAFSEKTDQYEIHIPKLVIHSKGAAEFNALLMDSYMPAAAYAQEMNVSDYSLTWESYVYDNILSILMTLEDDDSAPYHKFYYYDLDDDCQIYQQDVLDQMGLDAFDVRDASLTSAAEAFDDTMSFEKKTDSQSIAEYLTHRQASIHDAFMQSVSAMQFYPESDQRLKRYLSIFQRDSKTWSDVLCTVDLSKKEEPLSAAYAFIRIAYEPTLGEMRVIYEDQSDQTDVPFQSDYYRSLYGWTCGHPYVIQGCFSHYIDAEIVNAGYGTGKELEPILFLLTDHGTVEYVDLFLSALFGHYFNQGPVYGVTNVRSLEAGEGAYGSDGPRTMYALTNDNQKIDLMERLFPGSIAPSLKHTWSMEDQKQYWSLTFDDNGQCIAEYGNGSGMQTFQGSASRIGTNEHGVVYAVDYEDEMLTSIYVINVLERMILIRELEGSESVFDWQPQEEHDLYLADAKG